MSMRANFLTESKLSKDVNADPVPCFKPVFLVFETAPPGVFDGLKAIPLHCSGYKLLIATDMCCD